MPQVTVRSAPASRSVDCGTQIREPLSVPHVSPPASEAPGSRCAAAM